MPKGQGHITIRRRPKDGTDGKNAVILIPDISSYEFKYNSLGALLNDAVSTNVRLYDGDTEVLPGSVVWDISEYSGCTSSQAIIASGELTISGVNASGYVVVQTTYNGNQYTAKFSFTRSVEYPTYDLSVNPAAVVYKSGETPASVNVKVNMTIKVAGGKTETSAISSLPDGYYLAVNGSTVTYPGTSGYTFTPNTSLAKNIVNLIYDGSEYRRVEVTVTQVEDGEKGADGKDGTDGKDGKGIYSQTEYYAVGTATAVGTNWQEGTPPAFTSEYKYLWKYTVTTYTDGTSDKTTPCIVGAVGSEGLTVRQSTWTVGTEYHNDNNPFYRDENGVGYLDVVTKTDMIIYSSANPPDAWECQKTHKAANSIDESTNPPQYPLPASQSDNAAWVAFSTSRPIITSLILANKIAAGMIDVEDLAANTAFINNLVARKLIAGVVDSAGKITGERVEITPDNKSVDIYDASGDRVQTVEGNSYTSLSKLFGGDGSFTIQSRTSAQYGYDSGVTLAKGTFYPSSYPVEYESVTESFEVAITNTVYTTAPAKVKIGTGKAYAYASAGSWSESSVSLRPGHSAYANLHILIKSYSDSSCTKLITTTYIGSGVEASSFEGEGVQTDEQSWSACFARIPAGYHKVFVAGYVEMTVTGSRAYVTWGTSVLFSNIEYVGEFYTSRYFANGFCLGTRSDNYIFACNQGIFGMRLQMENSGYGLDVSRDGIKYRHHSGNWLNLPLLVAKFRVKAASSKASIENKFISWNGEYPTVTHPSKGTVRVIFPTTTVSPYWGELGLTEANMLIVATGYLSDAEYSKTTIRNISSSGFTLYLSDDNSLNDNMAADITIFRL